MQQLQLTATWLQRSTKIAWQKSWKNKQTLNKQNTNKNKQNKTKTTKNKNNNNNKYINKTVWYKLTFSDRKFQNYLYTKKEKEKRNWYFYFIKKEPNITGQSKRTLCDKKFMLLLFSQSPQTSFDSGFSSRLKKTQAMVNTGAGKEERGRWEAGEGGVLKCGLRLKN